MYFPFDSLDLFDEVTEQHHGRALSPGSVDNNVLARRDPTITEKVAVKTRASPTITGSDTEIRIITEATATGRTPSRHAVPAKAIITEKMISGMVDILRHITLHSFG